MILNDLKKELKKNIDEKYREGSFRFFKEEVKILGVRTPIVRRISKDYFKQIKNLDKKEILALSEALLKLGYLEYNTVAISWARMLKKDYQESDFKVFKSWLNKYVDNWATCDDFCTHVIHEFIEHFSRVIPQIKSWTRSKNRWLRRAAAVSFVTVNKKFYNKKNIEDVFEVARTLLKDKDDLVQKGYGWMLKSAADAQQKKVFDFVIKHKKEMPRTALRYAIEKMPKKLKKEAMKK
jgi:3-methyladenine DNA glycosylase AlkD